ncbi:MAG: hypothetical protein FJ221_13915 [Lentisphaerae bacterium]|nr:hypothetical protein [Lentisphaerota bacterium]
MDRSLLGGVAIVLVISAAAGVWVWTHWASLRKSSAASSPSPAQSPQESALADLPKRPIAKPIRLRRFSETAQYEALQQQADAITLALSQTLRFEDSAYRAICHRSEALRLLLGLLTESEGAVLGTQAASGVAVANDAAASDLRSEDSAIRAIFKNDQGSLLMLGTWCQVVSRRDPDPWSVFSRAAERVDKMLAMEDSAYRADTVVLSGFVVTLSSLAETYLGGGQCAGILSDLHSATRLDDSALRVATAHAQAGMRILLLLVAKTDAAKADAIALEVGNATLLDDSTLRVHAQYKQGMVDAVRFLIAHPPSMR